MQEKKEKVTEIVTNKNLSIDYSEWRKNITSKRYSYYDFDRAKVEEIAKKDIRQVTPEELSTLVQALFPQYLLCSGLFDGLVIFEVNVGVRIDPPKYWYRDITSYLNNDRTAKKNLLALEIEDLFKQNKIKYSESWQEYFKNIKSV